MKKLLLVVFLSMPLVAHAQFKSNTERDLYIKQLVEKVNMQTLWIRAAHKKFEELSCVYNESYKAVIDTFNKFQEDPNIKLEFSDKPCKIPGIDVELPPPP